MTTRPGRPGGSISKEPCSVMPSRPEMTTTPARPSRGQLENPAPGSGGASRLGRRPLRRAASTVRACSSGEVATGQQSSDERARTTGRRRFLPPRYRAPLARPGEGPPIPASLTVPCARRGCVANTAIASNIANTCRSSGSMTVAPQMRSGTHPLGQHRRRNPTMPTFTRRYHQGPRPARRGGHRCCCSGCP